MSVYRTKMYKHKCRSTTMVVPAEIAKSLPPHTEWDVTVEKDGLRLRYVGEYEKGTRGRPVSAVSLPFAPRSQRDAS